MDEKKTFTLNVFFFKFILIYTKDDEEPTLSRSIKLCPIFRAWLGFPRMISKLCSRPSCLLTLDSRRCAHAARAGEGIRSRIM